MILDGYAGTGKSSTIAALVRVCNHLKIPCVLLAPTGRAAKVLGGYSGKQAYTIHKWIYRRNMQRDGFYHVGVRPNLNNNALFVVDEASMISNKAEGGLAQGLLDDLMEFVFSAEGNSLLLCGDKAQLPPVGTAESPALDLEYMKHAYAFDVYHASLKQVVRQKEESGILFNATMLRKAFHNNEEIKVKATLDVKPRDAQELSDDLEKCFSTEDGKENVIVLCRSNKRANLFNKQIRASVLQYDEELNSGDLLMITRNNYFWLKEEPEVGFLANGDIVQIRKVIRYIDEYGLRFADVEVFLLDFPGMEPFQVRVLLEALHVNAPSIPEQQMRALYESILLDSPGNETRPEAKKRVQNDPFYQALQVKYAYAVTVHKAQGGQWENVVIDYGFMPEDAENSENTRWLYTAFTRATKQLWLFGFPENMVSA